MATNDFQPFAYGGAANVVSQSAYIALTSILQNGFSSGVAQSAQLNKVWRQSSIMAAVLAQFSSDYSGQNSTDDGTTATLETNLIAAIRSVTKTGVLLTDTGAANAYTASNVPALTSGQLVNGLVQQIVIAHANTGASTYAPDGLTASPIYGLGLQALQGGELPVGSTAVLMRATIAGVNGGSPIWVLMECAGGAQQVAPATQSQHAPQMGQLQASFRNRLINGCFQVDQRNGGAAQTITAGAALAYTVDRWYAYCTGANVTGQQVAGNGPDQFAYRFTGASGVTGLTFGQRIEASNSYDLNSSTATLQAKLSSSTLTTVTWTAYYANTKDTFGTVASPTKTQIATGTFTINSTPTVYSTQIAIPAAATTGICVEFSVGAFASGTLTYENAQLEPGSVVSAIERPDFGTVMNRCLRYCYQTSYTVGGGQSYSGQIIYTSQPFPTIMRVSPTITAIGSVSTSGAANGGPGITANTFNSVLAMSSFNALNTNGTAVGTNRFDSEL